MIVQILGNIADILELQNVQFKPQAYRRAAMAIEALTEDIEDIYRRGKLKEIPGVGEHLALKIEEIIKTGKLQYYEKLKKQVKVDIEELNRIPMLGSKRIKILYDKLGVKNAQDLEQAIKKGKLQKLPGFGEKIEQTLLEGIKLLKSRPRRFLYSQALPVVNEIIGKFSKYDFVKKIEIAGSFRRGKETVGDLDFLAVSSQPAKVMEAFISMPDVKEVLAKGQTKSSVRLNSNLQMDMRVVQEKEFGSALLYFIGNKDHNIALRKLALKKGYTLSEYGLFRLKGKKWVAGRTEEEVYKKLGLRYMPPEIRENMGEIAASVKNKLPKLVELKEVKGIFHNHSKWSDGNNSLSEIAHKAKEMNLKFISLNDHFGSIGIAHPLEEKRLDKYLKEIEKVRRSAEVKIFSGVEIDIMKDGSLPLPARKLKELDVVIAGVHSANRMKAEEMTKRLCYALENYPVNILAHPTSRLLNEREPIEANFDRVFETAKRNNVFLEINSSPKRMDLSGELVKSAIDHGCKLAISVDAHDISQMQNYPLGILMARRGWAEKKDILNCWELPKIEKALRK